MLTIILYLLHNFVVVICIERFVSANFAKSKTPKPVVIGSYLLYWALSSLVFLLLYNPISIAVIATRVLTTFIITLNYEAKMRRRLVVTFYFYVLILFIETLMRFAFVGRFGDVPAYVLYYTLISFVPLVLMTLFHMYQNLKEDSSPSRFWTASFVITFILFSMTVMSLYYFPQEIAVIAVSLIAAVNILNSVVHDTLSAAYNEKVRLMVDATEKEYYLSQCKLMQESVENVRSAKHDMRLHLATIKFFSTKVEKNLIDADEITNYINGLLEDIDKTEIYSNTGNIVVDSIINYKLSRVKDENINLDMRLLIPASINIETADIVSILGNLLENALEAVVKTDDKMLKLDMEYDKECLFIQINNSFDGVVHYEPNGIKGESQIASIKNSDKHGYGLKNIKRSIEKYNGHMAITHEGNVFSVAAVLYVTA